MEGARQAAGRGVTRREALCRSDDDQAGAIIAGDCRPALAFPSPKRLILRGLGRIVMLCHWKESIGRLGNMATGQLRAVLHCAEPIFNQLAYSPDGRTLATTSHSCSHCSVRSDPVELWDAESGRRLGTLDGAFEPTAFSPDSRTLATGGADGV